MTLTEMRPPENLDHGHGELKKAEYSVKKPDLTHYRPTEEREVTLHKQ